MATGHAVGKIGTKGLLAWSLTIDGKVGRIEFDIPDNLTETAKMEMLLSTSGFTPTQVTLGDGRVVKANVQIGASKPITAK